MTMGSRQLPVFVSALLRTEAYEHKTEKIQLLETHISWVILTGPYAYKIKKSIDLGFLDFSTVEKRHYYCSEELRLNSRLAPSIYLEVVPVRGPEAVASFAGSGDIIEYAVKMVQFPQALQLDRMLDTGMLVKEHMDNIAGTVAEFHQLTNIASDEDYFGDPERILKPVKENFLQIRTMNPGTVTLEQLKVLEGWSLDTFKAMKPMLLQRKKEGFIRECHGDLHLRNLVFIEDKANAFDCIEFDPELRWIDTISDIAFLIMDLQDRGQTDFAQQFLNTYLQKTGDYPGIKLLRFYLVYRALVRAKVEAISASQHEKNSTAWKKAIAAFHDYLQLASSYLNIAKPMLIITHGMSASGKTTLTQPLVEKLAAIRIRSDVERKRLFSIDFDTDSHADFNKGIYTAGASQQTYQYLTELAEQVLDADHSVIIDAACLKYEQRQIFEGLAIKKSVPFLVIEFTARAATLRERINSREKEMSDADQSVLEQQLENFIPIRPDERSHVLTINTESTNDVDTLAEKVLDYYKQNT